MTPILDETTLAPCITSTPSERIKIIASVLAALDRVGTRKGLRVVRDAAHRDIGGGRGLSSWCRDRSTDRDAGLLVATRLSKQPFIDGLGGLFTAAEGERAVEATFEGRPAFGLGLAALCDDIAVGLIRDITPSAHVAVRLDYLDEANERTETIDVIRVQTLQQVDQERRSIEVRLDRSVEDGRHLLAVAGDQFPQLRFGPLAEDQIKALRGDDMIFRQLLRHLRGLDAGSRVWPDGVSFAPANALSWSDESNSTLEHRRYGPMRDFPAPSGFSFARWRYHTKLTGGPGYRLYFRAERTTQSSVVLIGYFGPHLPTVRYNT